MFTLSLCHVPDSVEAFEYSYLTTKGTKFAKEAPVSPPVIFRVFRSFRGSHWHEVLRPSSATPL